MMKAMTGQKGMTNQIQENTENTDLRAKQLNACEASLALAGSGQRDRAMQLLVSLARNGEPIVRIRAAECFMEIGGERAVMELMDLIGDPHPQVRIAAIGALGALRIHPASEKLFQAMKTDPEITVRIMAARALGKLGNKNGLSLVIRLLDGDDEQLARLAVMALRDIIGQRFAPTLDGIKSAKRYLSVNLRTILAGG
jgi:HEAT repeat protein